jgi:DNA-binding PadR family transcriptional regulator
MANAESRAGLRTLSELAVLGLVSERPRHGWDIEQEIRARRLREWTPISISSVYHILNRLARAGLLSDTTRSDGSGVPQRVYRLTPAGSRALTTRLEELLSNPMRSPRELELAFMFAHSLPRALLLRVLEQFRRRADEAISDETGRWQTGRQKEYSDWSGLIWSHSLHHLRAEQAWVTEALKILQAKQTRPRGKRPAGQAVWRNK